MFWLLYRPSSTHRPHMYPTPPRPGMGNGGGRRMRQGSTSPAPLPLDSTPTQSGCCTGPVTPTDHPPFVSISLLLRHSSLRQSYFEKTTTKASYFSILSSIILCSRVITSFIELIPMAECFHIMYITTYTLYFSRDTLCPVN